MDRWKSVKPDPEKVRAATARRQELVDSIKAELTAELENPEGYPVPMTPGEMYVAVDALKDYLPGLKRAFGDGSLQVANVESLLEKLAKLGAGSS